MSRLIARWRLKWVLCVLAIAIVVGLAAMSPLLQWRGPIYIAACFAGIIAFCVMLVQPLLITGDLPTNRPLKARQLHRIVGMGIMILIIIHIVGLYWVSPMDVVDVLLLRSPTPFGLWGAIGFYAAFALSLVLVFKDRLSVKTWRHAHLTLAMIIVVATILHALQIEGTMEQISKWVLCGFVIGALGRIGLKFYRQ